MFKKNKLSHDYIVNFYNDIYDEVRKKNIDFNINYDPAEYTNKSYLVWFIVDYYIDKIDDKKLKTQLIEKSIEYLFKAKDILEKDKETGQFSKHNYAIIQLTLLKLHSRQLDKE